MQKKDVLTVLHDLGLKDIETKDNYVEVWNKIDLLDNGTAVKSIVERVKNTVATSAVTGEGCDKLLEMIEDLA